MRNKLVSVLRLVVACGCTAAAIPPATTGAMPKGQTQVSSLQITAAVLPRAMLNQSYSARLRATGGVPGYAWRIVAGQLPPGLTLRIDGQISGTPTRVGTYSFVAEVNDSAGLGNLNQLSITVPDVLHRLLIISTKRLAQGVFNQPYSSTLRAVGGAPSYAWSIVSGRLPPGLSLNADTGVLSGRPSQRGQFDFSVQVRDSFSPKPRAAMKAMTLSVVALGLQITPGDLPKGRVPVQELAITTTTLAQAVIVSSAAAALDEYGGDANHACVGVYGPNTGGHMIGSAIPGATGYFYLYKDSNLKRWMFCDPLGNRFFMLDVETVTRARYTLNLDSKYAYLSCGPISQCSYPIVQDERIKQLHFNTIGEYSDEAMFPIPAYNGGDPGIPAPNQLAFKYIWRPLYYSGAMEVISLLPPAWNAYRGGSFKDPFDPAFASFLNNASPTAFSWSALDGSPWFIGMTMDEGDNFWGLKNIVYDIGWIAGTEPVYIGTPYLNANAATDTQFHMRSQFQTYMQGKYASISALNTAWGGGANYTTFGSTATTVTNESIGTGDGSTATFTHTFAHGVVDPDSVGVSVAGTLQAGDCPWFDGKDSNCSSATNGRGNIPAHGTVSSGVVTYAIGGTACGASAAPCISVTFSSAPANGAAITVTYQYGGWPKAVAGGTGLLDEDGSSAWWPACCGFVNPPVGTIATDLHAFLTTVATEYYSLTSAALHAKLPHHLLFSVNDVDLGPHPARTGSMASPDLLTIAGKYADAFSAQGGTQPNVAGNTAIASAAYNKLGIPIIPFLVLVAQADSQFSGTACGWDTDCYPTLELAGQAYLSYVQQWWDNRYGFVGSDGYGFIVAADYWEWYDNTAEQTAFGILTVNDNLKDGIQNSTVSHPDPLMDGSNPNTIPETKNYGNFINNGLICGNLVWIAPCRPTASPPREH